MKLLFLILTIFIVNVWCKQRCYPIQDQTPKPKPSVIISDEACPVPNPVASFDVEKAAGDWYIVKAYPSPYFKGLSCMTESNIPTGSSTYNHTNCEKYEGTNSCMQFQANHVNGDGEVHFVSSDGMKGFAYYLDIDYDNYFITYVCFNLPDGRSQRILFINSRTRTLSDELLQKAYNKIESAGFSTDPLEDVEQNEKFCADRPSTIVSDKSCPNPLEYIKSFDVQQAAGDWFVVKAYPSIYFEGISCYLKTVVPTGRYIYNDTFCEKYNGAVKCTQVPLNHVDQDGKFIIDLPDLKGTGYFLHIDYETYFVSYACDNLENGGSQIIVYIGSRTRVLSDERLKEAYGKIQAAGLSVDALETVNQDEEFCGVENPKSIISSGACPAPNPLESFDAVKAASGRWYYVEAYPSIFFNGLDCYDANLVLTGPNQYLDTYCEKFNGTYSCKTAVKRVNNAGEAFIVVDGQDIGKSIYIYIDYDNYFVFYVCQNAPNGQTQRGVWIASRTPILSDELLHEAKHKIQEAGFDVEPLQAIRQDEEFCGRP